MSEIRKGIAAKCACQFVQIERDLKHIGELAKARNPNWELLDLYKKDLDEVEHNYKQCLDADISSKINDLTKSIENRNKKDVQRAILTIEEERELLCVRYE